MNTFWERFFFTYLTLIMQGIIVPYTLVLPILHRMPPCLLVITEKDPQFTAFFQRCMAYDHEDERYLL